MAQKKKFEASQRKGKSYLALWAVLILSGIVAKRLFGHPDWMVFFHLPAAMFLVLAGYHLSASFRERNSRYVEEWSRLRLR